MPLFPLLNAVYPGEPGFRVCESCVMDTSAPEISFDELGVCNYCASGRQLVGKSWFPDSAGEEKLAETFAEILNRRGRRFRGFDSILGLSGGVDSATVAVRAVEAGLRPLCVHVDGGWNSEESVQNIRNLVDRLGVQLETVVIDWDSMRKLQLAFLRSGTLNQDIPQDHAFFVSLYRTSLRRRLPNILSGLNMATENSEPQSWGYSNKDAEHIKSVYRADEGKILKRFPLMDYGTYKSLRRKGRFRVIEPLNFGSYDPIKSREFLSQNMGWQDYGSKHEESVFTKWFQAVYLPERYGIDKRKAHQSSLVIAGLTTRADAQVLVSRPPIDAAGRERLCATVADKLRISLDELETLIKTPHVSNHGFRTVLPYWNSPGVRT